MSLSYCTLLFSLSSAYYLNYDHFGEQLFSQPQLRFGLYFFQFYGRILFQKILSIKFLILLWSSS